MIFSAQLFNGGLAVNSTCRDCGLAMTVTDAAQTVHPSCTPRPTELEDLSHQWVEAVIRGDAATANVITDRIDYLEQVIDLPGAAAQYALWNWKVFPLSRQNKQPAIKSAHPKGDPLRHKCKGECGKPGHGLYDATNDVDRITRWWERHHDHNIGLATGHLFDVVDIDTKDADGNPDPQGVLNFLKLLNDRRLPQCHGIALTASGGMHLYVKATGKGNFTKVGGLTGIDYRGKGGYVVAPPSTLGATWRSYHWLFIPSPEIIEAQGDTNEF